MPKLLERGIYFAGTVRPNRVHGCKLLEANALKREGRGAFDHKVEAANNVVALRWYDTRAVTFLSSFIGPYPVDTIRRWDKQLKKHVDVSRPAIVKEYNTSMGGVDLLDSLLSAYTYKMKSRRWYVYLFWHTVNIAAWLLYRRDCKTLGLPDKSV